MIGSESASTPRQSALKLLSEAQGLSWKDGGFLGNICVATGTLSPGQRKWLNGLCDRHGLPTPSY